MSFVFQPWTAQREHDKCITVINSLPCAQLNRKTEMIRGWVWIYIFQCQWHAKCLLANMHCLITIWSLFNQTHLTESYNKNQHIGFVNKYLNLFILLTTRLNLKQKISAHLNVWRVLEEDTIITIKKNSRTLYRQNYTLQGNANRADFRPSSSLLTVEKSRLCDGSQDHFVRSSCDVRRLKSDPICWNECHRLES